MRREVEKCEVASTFSFLIFIFLFLPLFRLFVYRSGYKKELQIMQKPRLPVQQLVILCMSSLFTMETHEAEP